MSTWIDQKYIGLISNRLLQFKQKDRELYNFRCPICGDSQRSKIKARGWIFNKRGKFRFYCHNCGASMTFGNFLKDIDMSLHQEYMKDLFIENNINNPVVQFKPDITKFDKPKFQINSPLKQLKKISSLGVDHYAKKYVMSRKIPPQVQYKLFFCPNFKQWVNSFIPDKFKDLDKDEARLIIPFIDREKNFFGCQGRSFSKNGPRYITIILNEDTPRVFGLDSLDFSKQVYVFEGPIDSMFIENSIAMCGSDLTKSLKLNAEKTTIVFDNEPRSTAIVNKMSKYIDLHYGICFWPKNINGKDVNEMILNGHEPEELMAVINKNTYYGIEAKLQLEMWRKC